MQPVSTTPVATTRELVAKFATGVVNTGGKFAADVVDTGGNLPLVSRTPVATAQGELVAKFATGSLIPVANLPPMSLITAAICHR